MSCISESESNNEFWWEKKFNATWKLFFGSYRNGPFKVAFTMFDVVFFRYPKKDFFKKYDFAGKGGLKRFEFCIFRNCICIWQMWLLVGMGGSEEALIRSFLHRASEWCQHNTTLLWYLQKKVFSYFDCIVWSDSTNLFLRVHFIHLHYFIRLWCNWIFLSWFLQQNKILLIYLC